MQEKNNKKSNLAFVVFLIIFISLGVYLFLSSRPSNSEFSVPEEITQPQAEETTTENVMDEPVTEERNEVRIVISGSNFKFEPNIISAKVGDKVVVEFINIDGFHDFRIDEFNVATEMLETDESETVEFTVDKTGTFEFYCSVGEHRQMGMVGTLTVEEK